MGDLVFEGLEAFERFTRFTERLALTQEVPFEIAAEATSHVLYDHAVKLHGDSSKLAALAPSTQEERTRLGYSANEPLLRDGTLLRDHVERAHEGMLAGAGSEEMVALYHEFGYVTKQGGVVPPRPIYEITLKESEAEVGVILEDAVGAALGFGAKSRS